MPAGFSAEHPFDLRLSISEEAVELHPSNIFGKLGVSSRLELALLATRHNLGQWSNS
ncbi:MAG: LuxR C-terminal-related transcriptional regulator [Candidatus Sulfotelmatobacter sp.]